MKNVQDDPEAVPTPLTYFIACSAWYEDWYADAAEHSTEATHDDDDDASDEEGKTKHSEIDTGGASQVHSALALQPQGVAPPSFFIRAHEFCFCKPYQNCIFVCYSLCCCLSFVGSFLRINLIRGNENRQ